MASLALFPLLIGIDRAHAVSGLHLNAFSCPGYTQSPPEGCNSSPIYLGTVPYIDFQDGSGGPAGLWDRYQYNWTGYIKETQGTTVSFRACSDDGMRLYINGQRIVDDWFDRGGQCGVPRSYTMQTDNWVPVNIWFYENGGGSSGSLQWNLGSGWVVVPPSAFSTDYVAPVVVKTIGPPRNLSVVDGATATVLTWDAPNTGNTQPERYAISFSANGWGWGIATGNGGDVESLKTTMTISHELLEQLRPSGTIWSFSVRSDNDTQQIYSENSNVVTLKIGKPAEEIAAEQAEIDAENARLAEIARLAEVARLAEIERLAEIARQEEAARLEREAAALLAAQQEAARLAAEQEAARIEAERLAAAAEAVRIEAERLAALAEQQRIAAEQEAARQAALAAEAARLAAVAEAARIEAERQAAIKAEQDRLAAEAAAKAEADRIAAEKAAAEQAERDRLAAEAAAKAEAERQAAEAAAKKAEEERIAAEIAKAKAEEEARVAEEKRLKAEADAKAAEEARIKAEEEARIAEEKRLKAEEEAKIQAEKDAKAKADAEKAEADRIKAEEEAKAKAEEDAKKLAEQKAAEEAKAKAEADRIKEEAEKAKAEEAAKKAEEEKLAKIAEEAKEGKELSKEEVAAVVTSLVADLKPGESISAAQVQASGVSYSDLPASTPIEVRTSESGEVLVITAEVAANVELVTDAGALLEAAFTDPGAALAAIGSIGADMTEGEREEATDMVVATVVAAGAAMNAVGAATGSTGGSTSGGSSGGGSGGGGASGNSKGVRRRP